MGKPIGESNTDSLLRTGDLEQSDRLIAFLLFFTVLVSRLPFLSHNFGLDIDSWLVILKAREMSHTWCYSESRLPGFPLHEMICAFFYTMSAFRMNLLSAFFGSLATVGMYLSARKLGGSRLNSALLSGALAGTPLIYINSTCLIDYVWGLSLSLLSYFFLLDRNFLISAAFLGLAAGMRITYFLMIVPFSLKILKTLDCFGNRRDFVRLFEFWIVSFLTGIFWFLPLIQRYGPKFLSYFETAYRASLSKLIQVIPVDIWGGWGCICCAAILFYLLILRAYRVGEVLPNVRPIDFAQWGITIAIYLFAFLWLPHEAGYLTPIIPFLLFFMASFSPEKAFRVFCILFIVSSFIGGFEVRGSSPKEKPGTVKLFNLGKKDILFNFVKAPILFDRHMRDFHSKYFSNLMEFVHALKEDAVVFPGNFLFLVAQADAHDLKGFQEHSFEIINRNGKKIRFQASLDRNLFRKIKQDGLPMYYLLEGEEEHPPLSFENLGAKRIFLP